MSQAQITAQITDLEIAAQSRHLFRPDVRTFASGADIHAQAIPQGRANGEYVPGAIGPEYPTFIYGPRWVRVERAQFFNARAGAVVDKTQNLITLETKAAYLKYREAAERIQIYLGDGKKENSLRDKAEKIAIQIYERFDQGKAKGSEYLQAQVAADQMVLKLNEAMFNHALGLAALERITAGGYRLTAAQP